MYANSRFKKSVNEWGQVLKWIEPGDKISQEDISVSDEEWQYLIDHNVVVEEYPENLSPQVPLVDYYRKNPKGASTPLEEEEVTSESDESEPADENEQQQQGEKKLPWETK